MTAHPTISVGVCGSSLEYAASGGCRARNGRTSCGSTRFPAFRFFLLGETFQGSDKLFQLLFLPPLEAAFFPFPFTLPFLVGALAGVAQEQCEKNPFHNQMPPVRIRLATLLLPNRVREPRTEPGNVFPQHRFTIASSRCGKIVYGMPPCAPVPPKPIKPPPRVGIFGLPGFLAGLSGWRLLKGLGGAGGAFFFAGGAFFLEAISLFLFVSARWLSRHLFEFLRSHPSHG